MALLEYGLREEGWQVLEKLNPARRGREYLLEPYYVAAEIYTNPNAAGHGGWPLYTGASGWYYRAVVETLLGIRFAGDLLRLEPRFPASWDETGVELVLRGTRLSLRYRRGDAPRLLCDGIEADSIPLDGRAHDAICFFV
jgi:cyclic beta-1,2-glucan synthetase